MKHLLAVSIAGALIVTAFAGQQIQKIEYGDDWLRNRLSLRGKLDGEKLTPEQVERIMHLPRNRPVINYDSVYIVKADWLAVAGDNSAAILFNGSVPKGRLF